MSDDCGLLLVMGISRSSTANSLILVQVEVYFNENCIEIEIEIEYNTQSACGE